MHSLVCSWLGAIHQLKRRWTGGVWIGVLALVTAAALGPPASASPDPHDGGTTGGDDIPRVEGPRVVAASFSGGQLHETLTFHKSGVFVAHVLFNPPAHWTGGDTVHGRLIALGNHMGGPAHLSFALGTLKPGRYRVVITPQRQTITMNSNTVATWVYFTARANGTVTGIKLINPKPKTG
jgi:hypothetical protein